MTEPDETPPPPSTKSEPFSRSPAVLIGLGALVLGGVGAAFLTMGRSAPHASPTAVEQQGAAARQVAQLREEQEAAEKKIQQLQGDLGNAKDEGERARFQQQIQEAKNKGGGARPAPAPRAGAATRCAPGDPLCTDDLAPPPPGVAASAAAQGIVAGMKAPERAAPKLDGEVAIDPNGRFATTYRPGGGHLSAFEAAVARGSSPPATASWSRRGRSLRPRRGGAQGQGAGLKFDWSGQAPARRRPVPRLRIGLRSTARGAGGAPAPVGAPGAGRERLHGRRAITNAREGGPGARRQAGADG
jgi:hypothetical protein